MALTKKSVFAIILIAVLSSCGQNGYKITGEIKDYTGDVILVVDKQIVQTTTTTDGTFSFQGDLDIPLPAEIITDPQGRSFAFILTNQEVDITSTDGNGFTITGSPLTEKLDRIDAEIDDLYKKANDSLTYYGKLEDWNNYDRIGTERNEQLKRIIRENNDNTVGALVLEKNSGMFTEEEVFELIGEFAPEVRSAKFFDGFATRFETAYKLRIGTSYIDLSLPDADGKTHKISDYLSQEKYVILEFWASWCGPCLAKIPALKEIYGKFQDKGVEIYAVSMDENKDSWIKSYTSNELEWVQVSNLKAWDDNPLLETYGIRSVPLIFLIAPDGTILEKTQYYVGNILQILEDK